MREGSLSRVWAGAALLALAACGGGNERSAGNDDTGRAAAEPNVAGGCGGDRAPAVVGPGFVGPLRVGGRLADLPAGCAVRDTTYTLGEGMTEHGWAVELPGGGTVLVETGGGARDAAISRVFVETERARTEGDVGVGSSVTQLRQAHGETCAAAGEGALVVAARALRGISFVTDASPAVRGVAPGDARITRLIVLDPASSLCGGSSVAPAG